MKYDAPMQCPLCASNATVSRQDAGFARMLVECPACKRFSVDDLFLPQLRSLDEDRRYRLCAVAREAAASGHPIELSADNYEDLSSRARRWVTLSDGLDRLLLELSRDARGFRDPLNFSPQTDFPLICARGAREVEDLMQFAEDLGLYKPATQILTWEGWQRVEELRGRNPSSRQAFVAMSFKEELKEAYTLGFKPGIEASGYFTARRVDEIEYNESIDDRIVAEIRRSTFVVADFTQNRRSVYFEAGYGLGLGLDVIWTCREDHLTELEFDVRQKNHIVWKDLQDLRLRLDSRIRATVLPVGWR